METRANYLLIGAFTLAGILGALGFFLWLAKVEVDRQYAYYDTFFEDVTGLGRAGEVRYNGLLVGRVVDLALAEDPSEVRIRLELDAETPVKADTYATLEYWGVTGVTYVALQGGSPDAPLLRVASEIAVPVIQSRKSAFQSIFEAGPELMEEAVGLLEQIAAFVTPENREAVSAVLANLANATGELDAVLSDFTALSGDLSTAADELTAFTGVLAEVAGTAETTLLTANDTLASADETFETATGAIRRAESTIDEVTAVLTRAGETFAAADALLREQVPPVLGQVGATAGAAEEAIVGLTGRADEVADRLIRVGDLAAARLDQAEAALAGLEGTLAQAESTMAAIEDASTSVDALVEGEATALVADLRGTLAEAGTAIEAATGALAEARETFAGTSAIVNERVPGLLDTAEATLGTVQNAARDAGAFTERLPPLAEAATARLAEAEATIAGANEVLAQTGDTMAAVEGTSNAATALIQGEAAAAVRNLNQRLAQAEATLTAATGALTEAERTFASTSALMNERVPGLVDTLEAAAVDVGDVAANANAFTEQLVPLAEAATARLTEAEATIAGANRALAQAGDALQAVQGTSRAVSALVEGEGAAAVRNLNQTLARADETLTATTGAMTEAEQTLAAAETVVSEQLPGLIDRAGTTLTTVDRVVSDVGGQAGQVMQNLGPVTELLVARLGQAETTLAQLENTLTQAGSTLASVEETSDAVGTLVATDAEALVADARATMATARTAVTAAAAAIEQDLPQIMGQVRATTETINGLIAEASPDVLAFTERLDGLGARADAALATATVTFAHANTTLAAMTGTMETAEDTLSAAGETFTGVNRLVEEDLDAILADVRETTAALSGAVGPAVEDLPAITAQVQETVAGLSALVETLRTTVGGNAGKLDQFLESGPSEFVRFAQEARQLVENLQRLTAKIERDPARFFLGTQAREFRR